MSEEKNNNDVRIEPEDEKRSGFGRPGKEKKVQKELEQCRKERREYLEGWQRAKADLINTRKDFERKEEEVRKYANENLVLELLLVLDSFDMAFSNKESWENIDEGWRKGMEHIHSQLETVLRSNGISVIKPKHGDMFDANKHESVESITIQNEEDGGEIAEVVQKGYMLHDKVIRPAKVKVYSNE